MGCSHLNRCRNYSVKIKKLLKIGIVLSRRMLGELFSIGVQIREDYCDLLCIFMLVVAACSLI